MGDLFKAVSSGLGRFVFAWLVPSVVVCGLAYFLLVPAWGSRALSKPNPPGAAVGDANSLLQGALFLLTSLTLAVVSAYSSRPIYQFLEGYTMPRWLSKPLRKRSHRRYLRLQAMVRCGTPGDRAWASEQLRLYPEDPDQLMPTRIGNALKAIETYGASRFGLDSQTLWFEIQTVAHPDLKRDADETQGSTDFFISAMVHLGLLATACWVTLIASIGKHFVETPALGGVIVLGLACSSLVYPAYRQAVNKVGEWRWTLQALVNMSRPALATALSLKLPPTHSEEVQMWSDVCSLVLRGPNPSTLSALDKWRKDVPDQSDKANRPHRLLRKYRGLSRQAWSLLSER